MSTISKTGQLDKHRVAKSFLANTADNADALKNECKDEYPDCASLGQFYCSETYMKWAWKHCINYCGWCDSPVNRTFPTSTHTTTPPLRPGCLYNGHIHAEGDVWQDGCQYNCSCIDSVTGFYRCRPLCPNYQDIPSECRLETVRGQCCPILHCTTPAEMTIISHPESEFCYYKGHHFEQGAVWYDGCDQQCTCKDKAQNFYTCSAACLSWDALPKICHLDPAPPGLCCQQVNCPAKVIVNIPSTYKDQYPSTQTHNYTYV